MYLALARLSQMLMVELREYTNDSGECCSSFIVLPYVICPLKIFSLFSLANRTKIPYRVSLAYETETLFKWAWSYHQDSHHAHIN